MWRCFLNSKLHGETLMETFVDFVHIYKSDFGFSFQEKAERPESSSAAYFEQIFNNNNPLQQFSAFHFLTFQFPL